MRGLQRKPRPLTEHASLGASPQGWSRRRFLHGSVQAGGGLVIAFSLASAARAASAGSAPPRPGALAPRPDAFLRIGTDDRITVLLAHSEMGQGIWTTLPMLIAEELDCELARIDVEHAPTAPEYRHTLAGNQSTGGSTSTRTEFQRYREVGAMARALLVSAAATRFGVAPARCRTQRGVVHAGRRSARYGELAAAAAQLPLPDRIELKAASGWQIIGRDARRLDAPQKSDGSAQFGLDQRLPGMLTAMIARPPRFGARLLRFDASDALRVPGVREVFAVPSGVAIVAEGFWSAKRAREQLRIEWDEGPIAQLSSEGLRTQYRALVAQRGRIAAQRGDLDAAFARASASFEAEYAFPFLAHAAMEPLNCTVRIANGECDVWVGTQMQEFDRDAAAEEAGLPATRVRLHTPFLGGGFGRRAAPDSHLVREAVQIAKRAGGRPIQLVWTREDDIRGGYYRPAYLHRVHVGVDAAGSPIAWQQVIVGQSVAAGTRMEALMTRNGIDRTSVEGSAGAPYLDAVTAHRIELHSPSLPVPAQAWRSVGHTHNAFVVETLIDELAARAARDPIELRLALLAGHPRHRAVLERAAAFAGWKSGPQRATHGVARGVALHESYGSIVAQVADVALRDGEPRVERVWCVIDCGLAVNPAGVRAQMESGIAFGLGAALYGRIDLAAGGVPQGNYDDYRVLRLPEMPRVAVDILRSADRPTGGAGEPAVPPIGPAVANALAQLQGRRARELPLVARA